MEFSNFPRGLALHGQQCGMMVKLRDNGRSSLDGVAPMANISRSVEKLNLNQI